MSHHHRRHRGHGPIPPIPPIPPIDMEGARSFSFEELRRWLAGRGGRGPFHFDFDFDFDRSGGPGPRGRRGRRMFEGGELRLVLLKLIADEPRHGYDLIRAIEELTGGQYAPSPGVVYPTLTLLQDMGFIEEAPGEGARKPFQVTDEGRAHLEEKSDEVAELIERLEGMAPKREHSAGPAIGRSIKNLMYALKTRVAHDGWNEDLLSEIVDILDDAAQRIERVKPAASDQ